MYCHIDTVFFCFIMFFFPKATFCINDKIRKFILKLINDEQYQNMNTVFNSQYGAIFT